MAAGKGINEVAIPEDFGRRMNVRYGEDRTDALCQALTEEPAASVQLNPLKAQGRFEEEEVVPWFPHGRYLKERPVFTLAPVNDAGVYYWPESA